MVPLITNALMEKSSTFRTRTAPLPPCFGKATVQHLRNWQRTMLHFCWADPAPRSGPQLFVASLKISLQRQPLQSATKLDLVSRAPDVEMIATKSYSNRCSDPTHLMAAGW